jgi:hypothetical protein
MEGAKRGRPARNPSNVSASRGRGGKTSITSSSPLPSTTATPQPSPTMNTRPSIGGGLSGPSFTNGSSSVSSTYVQIF